MGKLIIDPAFQAQLAGLKEPTVLTDSSGMPLGKFVNPADWRDGKRLPGEK